MTIGDRAYSLISLGIERFLGAGSSSFLNQYGSWIITRFLYLEFSLDKCKLVCENTSQDRGFCIGGMAERYLNIQDPIPVKYFRTQA